MSFTPLTGGISTALSGAVEPGKFFDVRNEDVRNDIRSEDLYAKHIHNRDQSSTKNITKTIIVIIISAIIFVTVISLYDILRNGLNNYYANIALHDPNSHNTPEDIERTEIANQNQLWSSIIFSLICVASAVIIIIILVHIYTQISFINLSN